MCGEFLGISCQIEYTRRLLQKLLKSLGTFFFLKVFIFNGTVENCGIILKKNKYGKAGAEVKTMVKAGEIEMASLYYFQEDIRSKIEKPTVKNNRGHYSVPEMEKYN